MLISAKGCDRELIYVRKERTVFFDIITCGGVVSFNNRVAMVRQRH